MTEHQREAPDRPEAERYYAQYSSLEAGPEDTSEAALAGGHQRRRETELEADQGDERPHERGRLPSVGYVGVLLRLAPPARAPASSLAEASRLR